jgi:UDP-GlcNAc:undecaprenyl-phosphate GlcNAc-1-phosphate transferase
MCVGLLVLSLAIVYALPPDLSNINELGRSMAGARVILCLSLLGACLGFLVYNFNPASIFLGDAGSLLIGFLSVTIIMTFANLQPFGCPLVMRNGAEPTAIGTGAIVMPAAPLPANAGYEGVATILVMGGLAMFGLPIIDTATAIIRRRRAGVPFSTPDANHLHHRVKRAVSGSVRKAVTALYGMELGLVLLGLGVSSYVLFGHGRMLWPFLVLVGAFIVILLVAMRGTGAAPTTVRRPGGAPAAGSAPRDGSSA